MLALYTVRVYHVGAFVRMMRTRNIRKHIVYLGYYLNMDGFSVSATSIFMRNRILLNHDAFLRVFRLHTHKLYETVDGLWNFVYRHTSILSIESASRIVTKIFFPIVLLNMAWYKHPDDIPRTSVCLLRPALKECFSLYRPMHHILVLLKGCCIFFRDEYGIP